MSHVSMFIIENNLAETKWVSFDVFHKWTTSPVPDRDRAFRKAKSRNPFQLFLAGVSVFTPL